MSVYPSRDWPQARGPRTNLGKYPSVSDHGGAWDSISPNILPIPTTSPALVVPSPTLPTSSPSLNYSNSQQIASTPLSPSTYSQFLSQFLSTSPTLSHSTLYASSSSISVTAHISMTTTVGASNSASVATPSSSGITSSHHSSTGAVVGGIVASVSITFIIGSLFCFWLRRRRRNTRKVEQTFDLPVSSETMEICSPDRTSAHYILDTRRLSQISRLTPLRPGATPRFFASQNTGYPVMEKSELLHNISSWEANNLSRQNEILRRENKEFWEDIENLQRVNEEMQLRDVKHSK